MAVGRTTQVTVGSEALDVSTKLHTGNIPTIETLVSQRGQIVFRTSLPIEDLNPIFDHDEEVLRRVEAQHASVLDTIRRRLTLGDSKQSAPAHAATTNDTGETPQRLLEKALSHMGNKEFPLAEDVLREVLTRDPSYSEAKELLEIVVASAGQKTPPITSISDRLRAGAEALTRGWKSSAIQNWARGLSADPANRIFQLLVLLTTTPSAERRSRYLQELLGISSDLLAGNRPEEAHALLLALQAIEDPKGVSPHLSGAMSETAESSPSPSNGSKPNQQKKPTDTQPTAFVPGPHQNDRDSVPAVPPEHRRPEVARDEHGEDTEHHSHPERQAALLEASQAESQAAQEEPLPSRVSMQRTGRAMWQRLGSPYGIALAAVGTVLFLSAAFLVFWPSAAEEGQLELERAARLANAGQFRQAITVYDHILEHGQLKSLAYLGRGRARLATGEAEEGLSDLARAAELAPESAEVLEEMADGLYSRGHFAKAVEYYNRTISLGRDSADIRYRMATSLVQLDRNEEALPHLETALALETAHGEGRYLYGKLLNRLGRHAEAENQIRGARTRFDPGADYFVELAIALLEQGKLDGAEEMARELQRHEPSDARAHTLLGEVYLARKRLDASRQELILALQTNSEQPRAHLALARVWLSFGRSRGDRGELTKARQILEEKHGIPEGERLLALGEVSLAEGDAESAIELLEQALAQRCERLPARLALAEARFVSGDLNGAAEELEAADILAPEDAAIPLSLGIVHSQRGDLSFASREYLKALHRLGLSQPVQEESGPVMLPAPYLTLPPRFDVNRVIRDAYRKALAENETDEIASSLRDIAESTSFLIAT